MSRISVTMKFPGSKWFVLTALVFSVICCSHVLMANSLSKTLMDRSSSSHHHHQHIGCDAIQRILNKTSDGAGHQGMHLLHDKDEGFLVDHEQWHNHKDCE